MHFSTEEIFAAYLDCRKGKRNTSSCIEFELDLARNICVLRDELNSETYRVGTSRVFVVTEPKPREVWAAGFRDRVVHHVLYNRIGPKIEKTFAAGSCACIKGRGTLYGAKLLEKSIRSGTENWTKPLNYLSVDISNFFVSISKTILSDLLIPLIHDGKTLRLALLILNHDVKSDYTISGNPASLELVPYHKSLFNTISEFGLAIGWLVSQFYANVYMNVLDQHVVHKIKPHGYVRYVDDFTLVDRDLGLLRAAKDEIEHVMWDDLLLVPNPTKTKLNTVYGGVDFVGKIIKPWHTVSRPTIANNAIRKIQKDGSDVASINSSLGLLRQSKSFRERKKICRAAMRKGYAATAKFEKVRA